MIKFNINIKILSIIGLLSTLVISCTETIDDINYGVAQPRLAVSGSITTDTTSHKIILTKSGNMSTNSFEHISNAEVSIFDGTTTFPLTEDASHKGTYLTAPNVYGVAGKTYTLTINNIDIDGNGIKEQYTAKSELIDTNPIDSIHVVYDDRNQGQRGWFINLFTWDKGGRNFYVLKARKNNILISDSIFKYSYSDNTAFEGRNFSGLSVYFFDSDYERELVFPGDTITLELCSVTEGYYNFIREYLEEYYPKIPIFSGASSNISTNISPKDKAVGFFAAYAIKRKSTIYHGERVPR